MRTRLSLLAVTVGLAIVAVACGRATQEQIDAALGITPTATLSAEQIATGTANAVAAQETRAAAQAMLASPGADGGASLAAAGDIVQGSTQFRLRCLNCHRVGSPTNAPVLEGPDNPAVALSDQELFDLVRTGEGHATPPGPLNEVTISRSQLINIIAYIRDRSR